MHTWFLCNCTHLLTFICKIFHKLKTFLDIFEKPYFHFYTQNFNSMAKILNSYEEMQTVETYS